MLLDGRKVAGILAEAGDHVVLGIGVNVGSAPWPGAGAVDATGSSCWSRSSSASSAATTTGSRPVDRGAGVPGRVPRLCGERADRAGRPRDRERAARLADRDRLTVHDGRHRRGLAEVEAQRRAVESVSTGAVVSIETGCSSDTVPSELVAVTTAT